MSIYICIYIYTYRLLPTSHKVGWVRLLPSFWRLWLTWHAPCKPFRAFGMHWADQGSQSKLFGIPVWAGAPISGPGWAGGGLEV